MASADEHIHGNILLNLGAVIILALVLFFALLCNFEPRVDRLEEAILTPTPVAEAPLD